MNNPIAIGVDSTSQATPEEQSLAELLAALETAGDHEGEAVVADFLRQHPHLEENVRQLLQWRQAVEDSRPEPAARDLPERLGEFRMVRVLRSGGMGVICEAFEDRLHRRVAIKIIRRGRVLPEARDRFLREQQVLAQMHQTNIVAIFAAGEHEGLQYFVMPLIEGASLSQVIEFAASSASHGDGNTPSLAKIAKERADSDGRLSTTHDAAAGAAHASTAIDPLERASASDAAISPPSRATVVRLSNEYFRSVAETIAAAARAIDYAHRRRILHRDVKPANLMIEPSGQCWVIDFGLAGYLRSEEESSSAAASDAGSTGCASGLMGTRQYMAPEQFQLLADERTDVWGLGATLYELLALRPAFGAGADGKRDEAAIRRRIETESPPPMSDSVPNVPVDLQAICLKALEKEPARRYQTATALADDLRRWLQREPPHARRPLWRQAWLWSLRNRGWAIAIASAVLGVLMATTLLWRLASHREAQTQMEKLQATRLAPHRAGWFEEIEKSVAEIAARRGFSDEGRLRDQYVAALADIDAVREVNLPSSASSIAVSLDGKRFLFGGARARKSRVQELEALGARLWTGSLEPLVSSDLAEEGPVGFAADGAGLQLVANPSDRFEVWLWDIEKKERRRAFRLNENEAAESTHAFNAPILSLAPSGECVAASVATGEDRGETVAWSIATGERLMALDYHASALAFSLQAEMLAAASERDRKIRVYDLAGAGQLLTTIETGHAPVQALAFGKNPRLAPTSSPPHFSWLLAAGDSGGKATIWELRSGEVKSITRGSRYGFAALAFSPDSTLLASTGRETCKLSDVATGQFVLSIGSQNTMSGVAFSTDRRVALSGARTNVEGRLEVWRLDRGRGIEIFRGLSGAIEKAICSHDETLFAGLSTEWQVGVWDRRTGNLLQVVDVPVGDYVDSAALAFDRQNRRLAFVSTKKAVLWNIGSPEMKILAALPPALDNVLAFSRDGKRLVLARMETRNGDSPPYERPFTEFPRVLRVRNLLSEKPAEPLGTIEDFNITIAPRAITPFGETILAVGKRGAATTTEIAVVAIDGETGNEVWRLPTLLSDYTPNIRLDPRGERFGLEILNSAGATLWNAAIETRTLRKTGILQNHCVLLGPRGATYFLDRSDDGIRDWEFHRAGDSKRLFTLNIDMMAAEFPRFSSSGKFAFWGNRDGAVSVADLEAIQTKLAGR